MKQFDDSIRNFRRYLRYLEAEIGLNLSGETECCDVTVAQCHLLLEAEYRQNTSLQDLADALELDKSTLSRTVDALVRRDLVRRDEDPENRRKVSIGLTGKGQEKVDVINRLCDESCAKVFECIPAEKHEAIVESIWLLAEAMKKARKGATGSCCDKT